MEASDERKPMIAVDLLQARCTAAIRSTSFFGVSFPGKQNGDPAFVELRLELRLVRGTWDYEICCDGSP